MTPPLNDTDLAVADDDPMLDLDAPLEPAEPAGGTLAPLHDLSLFGKIPVTLTLEVASTEICLRELMEVDTHSVIVLDKLAGEPLDVKVNGTLFAKAEVVVMNGNYGLRILELSDSDLSDLAR